MRKHLVLAAASALGLAAIGAPAQAQMMGGYGGGYGPGYGMMGGNGGGYYGHGPGMMYGDGGGYGMGPGMMYGYGPQGQPYYGGRGQGRQVYRGKRLCWHQTGDDRDTGYYGKCPN
jgi:hypothetical protein